MSPQTRPFGLVGLLAADSTAVSSDTNQPQASTVPVANSQPPYYYQFTFLPPGTYTVAFTCQAAQDNPDQADSVVTFNPIKTGITVTAKQTTTVAPVNLPLN